MMLLIAHGDHGRVRRVVGDHAEIGGFDLDFWWELALLIVIMLLGHWLEMRALGPASGALDALAALLPDTAEKVTDDGVVEVPRRRAGGRVTSSWSGPVAGSPPTGRWSTGRPRSTSR